MKKFEKIKTNNIPLIDELVYNAKRLCMTSVFKDEELSLKYETVESIKAADLYIACIEGRADFMMFEYSFKELSKSSLPQYLLYDCLENKSKVPKNVRVELLKYKIKSYISEYVETNNYYRMLNGLPDYKTNGVKVPIEYLPQDLLDIIDTSKYIYNLTDNEVDVLYSFGIMDRLIQDNPDLYYLRYMGSRRIDIYTARTSDRFVLLYTEPDTPIEVLNRFKDKYESNRVYTLKVIYSDAFKLGSDYYDNFIGLFINLQTMIDMIAEMPDYIIKRDLFDIKMIKLFFEYHGVDFFPEIPYKYQKAMLRNLNRLIKFKSTTTNIVDICSLFGFDNIEIFKYYLLKERKVDKFGEYVFNYKELEDDQGNMTEIEDINENFDLKFLKVPIYDNVDNFIHDKSKLLDYDEVVDSDKYWNGELSHDLVKTAILEREFNYLQSKYLSIDTIYSLTELSFQLTYFHNMIFDNVIVEEMLKMKIPVINSNSEFKFVDIMCYLYSLTYIYMGIEDDLMNEPEQILEIKGFNFDVDMIELASYVQSQGFTLEELGVSEFQIPNGNILSYNQLMYIFTKNKNIHDHLIKQIYCADNKKIYDIYMKLYDSLMINELSMDFFRKKDGEVAKTYLEFIKDRDLILYYSLMEIRDIESESQRTEKINNLINDVIYVIEQYIETDEYKFIFASLPSVSSEAVKKYIYKVINFFKSYKVDIYNINTIYKFDDRLENKITMIDRVIFNYILNKYDTIEVNSKPKFTSELSKEDKIKLIDNVYFQITYWTDVLFDDKMEIKDNIKELLVYIEKKDCVTFNDELTSLITNTYKATLYELEEKVYRNSQLNKEDYIKLIDNIFLDITYWLDIVFATDIKLKDHIKNIISLNKTSYINIIDKTKLNIDVNYMTKVPMFDRIKISSTNS